MIVVYRLLQVMGHPQHWLCSRVALALVVLVVLVPLAPLGLASLGLAPLGPNNQALAMEQ